MADEPTEYQSELEILDALMDPDIMGFYGPPCAICGASHCSSPEEHTLYGYGCDESKPVPNYAWEPKEE